MPCAELADLLSAYADGQTTPAQTEYVEAHLAHCPRCRRVMQRHVEVRHLIRLGTDDAWTPPDLSLRVTRALQGRYPRARQRPSSFLRAGGSVIAVLLALQLLGLPASQPGASPTATVPSAIPTHALFPRTPPRRTPAAVGAQLGPAQSPLASGGDATTKGGRFGRRRMGGPHQPVAI